MNRKKKAFTLTELLVVVIIIGVLSAVVLPKFNKIIETRKTTEAEELMAVVRTEQEKRCSFDKNYLTTSESLADILPSSSTKNFDYSFTSTGMLATSKGKYKYQLQMPSYEDGRICCENATECLKLNKDYPLCSDLVYKPDYQDGLACAGEDVEAESVCTTAEPFDEQECYDGSKITRKYECVSGSWVPQSWSGECPTAPAVSCSSITAENWEACCASAEKTDTKCWKECTEDVYTSTYKIAQEGTCQRTNVLLAEKCEIPRFPANPTGTITCTAEQVGKICCRNDQKYICKEFGPWRSKTNYYRCHAYVDSCSSDCSGYYFDYALTYRTPFF